MKLQCMWHWLLQCMWLSTVCAAAADVAHHAPAVKYGEMVVVASVTTGLTSSASPIIH
jgi:hypothetical protein